MALIQYRPYYCIYTIILKTHAGKGAARPTVAKLETSGFLPHILGGDSEMADNPARSTCLESRNAPEAPADVIRAAETQGLCVSDFVVAAAQEAAHKTIEETQLVRLSLEDQIAFAEAIIAPPEPNDALRRARDAHRRLVPGTR
jgi:uncharacterized protein (DUF1778 family)